MAAGGPARRAAAQGDVPLGAEARGHYDAAMVLYGVRDFRAAARELEAAYAIEPRREILFARAQATRLAGDCPDAIALYQQFLTTAPPAHQVAATRIAMARCQGETPPPRAPPSLAAAPVVIARARSIPPAAVVAPAAAVPRPPFYRDWKGDVLLAAGLVTGSVGAALMASAAGMDARARAADRYGDFADLHGRAEQRWRVGLGAMVAGAVVAAAGVARYVWISLDGGVGIGGRF
jgi:hypothetical protein